MTLKLALRSVIIWAHSPLRLLIKDVSGLENVPRNKSFIIAANHPGRLDAFLLYLTFYYQLGIKVRFLTADGFFKFWISRAYLNFFDAIRIPKENISKAIDDAVNALRSHGERLYSPKSLTFMKWEKNLKRTRLTPFQVRQIFALLLNGQWKKLPNALNKMVSK